MRYFEEIMISERGWLFFKRKGKFVDIICPYSHDGSRCATYCPHFGEPDEANGINLCHGTLVVAGKIIDERQYDSI